ncbi:hypothetical protein B0J17DRAFT_666905 [Rhizoctonia solani]|nr:hypothetical protein B0J17DRAFT_666905 [Rhizoctonia solani]
MQITSKDTLNSVIKRWEDARDLLASTLTSYLDSCISLEVALGYSQTGAKDIASRIDLTLDSLQRDMSRQFVQSTLILAQTRNKLVSSIWSLPEELLSDIFFKVVYTAENKNRPMQDGVQAMYSSLHSLMAVCSVWRNIALTQAVLWETIPACDEHLKYRAINLSLQRSGDRGLRLVAILPKIRGSASTRLVEMMVNHASRIRALNVEGENLGTIIDMVTQLLLRDGVPSQLCELSIRFASSRYSPSEQKTICVVHTKSPNQEACTNLIESLAILRLSRVQVQWENMTFSNRLVELFIHGVKLGDSESALSTFLSAISSAIELRDLKMIEVGADRNPTETTNLTTCPKVVFPKLRTLLLHDLRFNVLEFFLLKIAPGSYYLTVGLTKNAVNIIHSNHTYDVANIDDLAALLKGVNVNALLLVRGFSLFNPWLDGLGARKLIESTPRLQELIMNGWGFDSDFCNGLFPSQISGIEHGEFLFPRLELLELTQARIFAQDIFKNMLANVSAHTTVLGGCIQVGEEDWTELEGGETIVDWLTCSVPGFRLVDSNYLPIVLKAREWMLW